MIGLDTNILVRLLIGDDPGQRSAAETLLRDAVETGEECFVSDPVLCETEWVLESCYGASRAEISGALQGLLAQQGLLVFENPEVFRRALASYQSSRVDFSDLLIGAKAQAQNARTTYTFDRFLSQQPGFSLLKHLK